MFVMRPSQLCRKPVFLELHRTDYFVGLRPIPRSTRDRHCVASCALRAGTAFAMTRHRHREVAGVAIQMGREICGQRKTKNRGKVSFCRDERTGSGKYTCEMAEWLARALCAIIFYLDASKTFIWTVC